MRGGIQRNDVISATFDPATLNCLVCKKPHNVMSGSGPAVIMLSDQNFVPALGCDIGCDTGCLAIVRMEDASLQDLADLVIEITDKNTVPAGSVFLIGSASHLVKASVSAYAGDWIAINNKLGQKFKSVNICPLIPLFLEDMPGVVARDIEILAMWLHKVYNTGIKGLSETWCGLVSHVQQNSGG